MRLCTCPVALGYWRGKSRENHQRAVRIVSGQERDWHPCLWVRTGDGEEPWSEPTGVAALELKRPHPRGWGRRKRGVWEPGREEETAALASSISWSLTPPWFCCFPRAPASGLPALLYPSSQPPPEVQLLQEVEEPPPLTCRWRICPHGRESPGMCVHL